MRVVMIAGAPGAGKSSLGRALAARTGRFLLDLDTATAAWWERDPDRLTRAERYAAVLDPAAENARLGVGSVLVAPFTGEVTDADTWRRLVERLGEEPLLVVLRLDAETALARQAARGEARDRRAPDARERALAPGVPALVLDATAPPDALLRAVLRRLAP